MRAESLKGVNERFLAAFTDLVHDCVARCQTEVLSAKVPLASYGRVKDALDKLKHAPCMRSNPH